MGIFLHGQDFSGDNPRPETNIKIVEIKRIANENQVTIVVPFFFPKIYAIGAMSNGKNTAIVRNDSVIFRNPLLVYLLILYILSLLSSFHTLIFSHIYITIKSISNNNNS